MSYSITSTNESGRIQTDSCEDQELTDSKNYSSEKCDDRKKLSYNEYSEQIIVHKWFLCDIRSLNNQKEDFYLQSSSFGCSVENDLVYWIIRFYPQTSKLSKTKCLVYVFDKDAYEIKHNKTNLFIQVIKNAYDPLYDFYGKW